MHDHPLVPLIHLLKLIGDYVFAGVTLAVVLSWLPHVTAVLAFSWWCFRWYGSFTEWRRKRRDA
jgi:hypothetical protein